jgi:phosphoribosyl 1,2-cyclic phosphate phosphodiesterase
MSLTLTILGCGSSGGVPRPALGWGICDPNNPKNRRRRCSLLIEKHGDGGKTTVLIDTSPDLREQLLDADVNYVDAVFLTHEHADQTHGIDDLRGVVMRMRRRIPTYLSRSTAQDIMVRFGYCFETPPGSDYPPILDYVGIEEGEERTVTGKGGSLTLSAFEVQHGNIPVTGYRFNDVAYTPDLNDIPERSVPALENLDLWIIDALRYMPHPSHFSVSDALSWIKRMKPRRAIITNMHTDIDYEIFRRELPEGIVPAYDGMQVTIG